MNRYTNNILLLGLSLLAWSSLLHAENADRERPIHLESDIVVVDNVNQTSVFEGKVELIQGTLRILAEKIVLTQDKEGYKHCTATGKLASFRQKQEGSNDYMEGYGERIEYDTRTETVDFFGQARIKREGDDVRGDHITYNTKTEVFQVSGDTNNADSPNQGRAHAMIQTKRKETTGKPAPNESAPLMQPSSTLSKKP
jgi:lipopolysaccharide export system protein LptA